MCVHASKAWMCAHLRASFRLHSVHRYYQARHESDIPYVRVHRLNQRTCVILPCVRNPTITAKTSTGRSVSTSLRVICCACCCGCCVDDGDDDSSGNRPGLLARGVTAPKPPSRAGLPYPMVMGCISSRMLSRDRYLLVRVCECSVFYGRESSV